MDKEEIKEKSQEKITLTRRQLWALYGGAFAGIIGALDHLGSFVSMVAKHWPL